jgi:hypothetical protein
MKRIILIALSFMFSIGIYANSSKKAYTAKSITFLGIDYSEALFVGTAGFRNPHGIKRLTNSWNGMFTLEYDKYNVGKFYNVEVSYNFDIVKERNQAVDYTERITDNFSDDIRFSREDLQEMINAYPDFESEGVAMVMIVDSYKKGTEMAYYHIVFFDMKSKEILEVQLASGKAAGFGIRNYWARSYKRALEDAGKAYRKKRKKLI